MLLNKTFFCLQFIYCKCPHCTANTVSQGKPTLITRETCPHCRNPLSKTGGSLYAPCSTLYGISLHIRLHFFVNLFHFKGLDLQVRNLGYQSSSTLSRIYLKWTRLNRHHEVRIQTCHFHLHAMRRGSLCEFS